MFVDISHNTKGFNMARFSFTLFRFEVQLDDTVPSATRRAAQASGECFGHFRCLQTVHVTIINYELLKPIQNLL